MVTILKCLRKDHPISQTVIPVQPLRKTAIFPLFWPFWGLVSNLCQDLSFVNDYGSVFPLASWGCGAFVNTLFDKRVLVGLGHRNTLFLPLHFVLNIGFLRPRHNSDCS